MQEQASRQFVGIDLHRRGSVIVRLDQAGNVLGTVRVDNDPVEFALAVAEAGEGPEVTAHQIEWVAAGLRQAASEAGVFLPVSYSRAVAADGLGRGAEVGVTRLGRGVVFHTHPGQLSRCPVQLRACADAWLPATRCFTPTSCPSSGLLAHGRSSPICGRSRLTECARCSS